ncbi:MAG: calcium-binding protein [Actinomycetes bacterium]
MHIFKASNIRKLSTTAFVLLLLGVMVPGPVAAASTLCDGSPATISSSARIINGTSGDDVITVLGAGAHTVNAGGGDDLICSGSSPDEIIGGPGNDVINSGSGSDVINAGSGSDVINAGSGNDVVNAGSGNDNVGAGTGNDTVNGGSGDDSLNGGAGNDALSGSNGADLMWGKSGNDSLSGGAGNDSLQGGTGRDTLSPGTGSNSCALDNPDQVLGTCAVDDVLPQVSNVSVMSSVVEPPVGNVSVMSPVTAGSKATFLWSISDTTGVGYTDLRIGGPSGWVNWCGFPIEGTRISGDAQQGTYSVECDIPETAVNTTYTAFINAADFFGNSSNGTSADFTVTGGTADDAEPTVNSVEVTSNIFGLGEELTVTYRATDESGVQYIYGYFYHDGLGVAGNRGIWISPGALSDPISGDEKDGVWQQSFTINDFAPIGTYTLYVGRSDKYGNRNFTQSDIRITVSAR